MSFNVTSLNTNFENGALVVSGTGESGMLAAQIVVYGEDGETIITTQSAEVDDNGAFSIVFEGISEGRYIIKAADYPGGEFFTVQTWTDSEEVIDDPTSDDSASTAAKPDTGRLTVEDTASSTFSPIIPIIGASAIALIAAIVFVVIKKRQQD